ncbi:3338_t:CDS:2, partial [Entrophospora sp. SA101]
DLTIWPGQDYSNPRVKDFQNVVDFEAELVDKSKVPRMPWHDVSIGMTGTPARDVARHFVQRWNFIKDEKAFERKDIPFLTPKGEFVSTRDESRFKGTYQTGTPARDVARHFVQRWNFIKDEKAFERKDIPFLTPKGEFVSTRDESRFKGTCNVQLLRSSSVWSSGIKTE